MLTPDAAFITAIKSGNVKVAELYEVLLSNGTTYYFTTHDTDITWGDPDALYHAIPLKRESIQMNLNLEIDTVKITLQNISGDLYNAVQLNVLDAAQITIKRILWNESGNYSSGMEITMFVGTADVTFNRKTLVLSCRSILDSLNVVVPRGLYQEPCIYSLFDTGCALNQSGFKISNVTVGASSNRYTVLGTTATLYKIDFDGGDSSNPISIGDALTGDIAGVGTCTGIVYSTSTTGFIFYTMSVQFVDDEVITGGGNDVTVNGTPAEDTTFYEMGEIKLTSGDNEGQRRMIRVQSGGTFTTLVPFPNAIDAGVSYDVYPGCDKTSNVCQGRFANAINFMGFLYIPQIQETVM